MKTKAMLLAAAATLMIVATAAEARDVNRNRSVTGVGGETRSTSSTVHSQRNGDGTGSRSATRTGPRGKSTQTDSNVSCAGGSCTGNTTATGPNGGTANRSTTVTKQ